MNVAEKPSGGPSWAAGPQHLAEPSDTLLLTARLNYSSQGTCSWGSSCPTSLCLLLGEGHLILRLYFPFLETPKDDAPLSLLLSLHLCTVLPTHM